MKISIEYEASWRNSFLDGSNSEPLPRNGRKFIGSIKELNDNNKQNYIKRDVTLDTVMGILNRLIGDQRKLYQARNEELFGRYYFKDIEPHITFLDAPKETSEVVYIRNISGNTDPSAFTGMIKTSDPIFMSKYSRKFWGVFALSLDELCKFILNDTYVVDAEISLDPLAVLERLEFLKKEKPVEENSMLVMAIQKLELVFPKFKTLKNKKNEVYILSLYCSSLYLQLERLEKTDDMSSAKSVRGGINGISNNGFTPKDFMDRYTGGEKKKVWGNPYLKKGWGGEDTKKLTKASGQLEIIIDVEREKAQEIKDLIDNAGVSAFYLGKKGLAYVSKIRI